MDPVTGVGLAASVAQLAGLAKDVVSAMYQYFDAVNNAPKRSLELRQEMSTICDLLNSLELILDSTPTSSPSLDSLKNSLPEFAGMLREMKARTDSSQVKGVKRLMWPFKRDENERLLSRIERYKSSLHMVLTIKHINDFTTDFYSRKRKTILEWLSTTDFHPRHQELRKTRAVNSGIWFLESDVFTQWMMGTGSSTCLICPGIRSILTMSCANTAAGSGKSILMSIAIDYLRDRSLNENGRVLYAYFDYKAQQTQSSLDVSKVLLKQLLCHDHSNTVPPELESLYDKSIGSGSSPDIDVICELLTSFSKDYSMYAVFDALDECSEWNRKDMLSLFTTLQKSGFRLLVSTRVHLNIQEQLTDSIILNITADMSDLRNFISVRLDEEGTISPKLRDKCLELTSRAEGMFLLVKFQLEHVLSFREPRKRMQAIETVPKDMFNAYSDVVQRIERSRPGDKELTMRILSWLFYAQRPLKMDELLEALVIETPEPDRGLDAMLEDQLAPSAVIECCKSLVVHEESSGLVRFTHYTVQEFIDTRLLQTLSPATDLARTCLTYMLFEQFDHPCLGWRDVSSRFAKYKLGGYAAHFWGAHAKGVAETVPDIQSAILQLGASEDKWNSFLEMEAFANRSVAKRFFKLQNSIFTEGQTLLHVVARNGLYKICQMLLGGDTVGGSPSILVLDTSNLALEPFSERWNIRIDIEAQDEDGKTPLHYASSYGEKGIVELLLDAGANWSAQTFDGQTAWFLALQKGHKDIARLLLDKHTEVDEDLYDQALQEAAKTGDEEIVRMLLDKESGGNGRQIALYEAACHGRKGIVQLLLEKGTEINLVPSYYGTALHAASHRGHIEILQLLLENQANVGLIGGHFGTVLQAASAGGKIEIVEMLLQFGADVDAVAGIYGSALQAAAYGGHIEILQLLLKKGVNIESRKGSHGTALEIAVEQGHEKIVRLLLEHGANMNVGTLDLTLLQLAAQLDDTDIMRLLLERGADVNATKGNYYCCPLQSAAAYGTITTIKLLLEHGANVNTSGGHFGNPLEAASASGLVDRVRLLLENGADVNASSSGYFGNALIAAAHDGSDDIVKLLLENGADVNATGNKFKSAIEAAKHNDLTETVQLLLDHGAYIRKSPMNNTSAKISKPKVSWEEPPSVTPQSKFRMPRWRFGRTPKI